MNRSVKRCHKFSGTCVDEKHCARKSHFSLCSNVEVSMVPGHCLENCKSVASLRGRPISLPDRGALQGRSGGPTEGRPYSSVKFKHSRVKGEPG